MVEGKQIGVRLKQRRKDLSINITKLSEKSGVSTGQISQIEQGKAIPSVVSLYKIATVLGVDLNYFFNNEVDVVVQKEGERRIVISNEGHNFYEFLSPSASRSHKIDFTKITIKANSTYEEENSDIAHEGEECGYVLSGKMVVHIDGENIVLNEGDSIYYKSTKLHHYENPFDEDCVSIWAMTPLFF